jgi:predicted membrane chloride channel (bestrophin family)
MVSFSLSCINSNLKLSLSIFNLRSSVLKNIFTRVIVCKVFSHVHKIKIQVSHRLSQDAFVVYDVVCTEV